MADASADAVPQGRVWVDLFLGPGDLSTRVFKARCAPLIEEDEGEVRERNK